jgi:hypothetical protein
MNKKQIENIVEDVFKPIKIKNKKCIICGTNEKTILFTVLKHHYNKGFSTYNIILCSDCFQNISNIYVEHSKLMDFYVKEGEIDYEGGD